MRGSDVSAHSAKISSDRQAEGAEFNVALTCPCYARHKDQRAPRVPSNLAVSVELERLELPALSDNLVNHITKPSLRNA